MGAPSRSSSNHLQSKSTRAFPRAPKGPKLTRRYLWCRRRTSHPWRSLFDEGQAPKTKSSANRLLRNQFMMVLTLTFSNVSFFFFFFALAVSQSILGSHFTVKHR